MNLSTGRILIIVALVVAGLAVLANGFLDDGATVAAPSGSASPSGTGSTTPPATDTPSPTATPAPQTKGVIIIALNGTDVTGGRAGSPRQRRVQGGATLGQRARLGRQEDDGVLPR